MPWLLTPLVDWMYGDKLVEPLQLLKLHFENKHNSTNSTSFLSADENLVNKKRNRRKSTKPPIELSEFLTRTDLERLRKELEMRRTRVVADEKTLNADFSNLVNEIDDDLMVLDDKLSSLSTNTKTS